MSPLAWLSVAILVLTLAERATSRYPLNRIVHRVRKATFPPS